MRLNFSNLTTQVKSATASVDMISVIASFWIKSENPGEVNIYQTSWCWIVKLAVLPYDINVHNRNEKKYMNSGTQMDVCYHFVQKDLNQNQFFLNCFDIFYHAKLF